MPYIKSDSIKAVLYIELGDTYKDKGEAVSACTNYNSAFDIALKIKYVPAYFWSAGVFSGQIHAYALVTLSAGYVVNENLNMNFNISNLLDRKHYEIFGGSILGRRSTLSATYSF